MVGRFPLESSDHYFLRPDFLVENRVTLLSELGRLLIGARVGRKMLAVQQSEHRVNVTSSRFDNPIRAAGRYRRRPDARQRYRLDRADTR
jgi:hypothetical protein